MRVINRIRDRRLGERHHLARAAGVNDHEIELIRRLHEECRLGYGVIAHKMGLSKSAVQKYCNYTRRAPT